MLMSGSIMRKGIKTCVMLYQYSFEFCRLSEDWLGVHQKKWHAKKVSQLQQLDKNTALTIDHTYFKHGQICEMYVLSFVHWEIAVKIYFDSASCKSVVERFILWPN